MRYYINHNYYVLDRLAPNDNTRVAAACRDNQTAEQICFYMNEMHYDNKRNQHEGRVN